MNLREQYKEKFGKFPSSQMKEETLLKKLGIDKIDNPFGESLVDTIIVEKEKDNIELNKKVEKEVMKLKTRTVTGYIEPNKGDKPLKMTSRRRAYLLKNK